MNEVETVSFSCFKIAPRLPLEKIASFFEIRMPQSWNEFLLLTEKHLGEILKSAASFQQVFLFEFGSITFVNFTTEEVSVFLEYLESITGSIQSGFFSKFRESHTLEIDKGSCRLWNNSKEEIVYDDSIIPIISSILAKSAALGKIEADVDWILDEAEKFINNLQKGRLSMKKRKYAAVLTKILRFEYDIINSVRIFDRPSYADNHLHSRDIFDSLAGYYELHDRFDIVESKMDDLRRITSAYSGLSRSRQEKRLLAFEVFLLALFPLSHLVHWLIDTFKLY